MSKLFASVLLLLSCFAAFGQVIPTKGEHSYAILRGKEMVGDYVTRTQELTFEGVTAVYSIQTTRMFDKDGVVSSETIFESWVAADGQPLQVVQTVVSATVKTRTQARFAKDAIEVKTDDGVTRTIPFHDTKAVFGNSLDPLLLKGEVVKERKTFYGFDSTNAKLVKGELEWVGAKTIDVYGEKRDVNQIDSVIAGAKTSLYFDESGRTVLIDLRNGLVMVPN